MKRTYLAVFVLTLWACLGGCIFSPKSGKGPPPQELVYEVPEYPDRVIDNMIQSYTNRDSVSYRRCLDFDYKGTSKDLTDGTQAEFFNADEVAHIQALARAISIVKVTLDLGTNTSWARLTSDDPSHPEWAVYQISGSQFRLEINDSARDTYVVNDAANTYTFRFRPYTDKVHGPWTIWNTSRSDTLWTLVQWEEVHPS